MATTTDQIQSLAGLETLRFGDRAPGPMGPHTHLAEIAGRLAELRWDHLDVRPMSPTIGAEVAGVSLAPDVPDAVVAEIRAALLAHKVLVFRDQDLTTEGQMDLARRFGEIQVHPFLAGDGKHDEIVQLVKDERTGGYENIWHSDVSWWERPSMGTILRAVEVPPVGGDTLFADMEAALLGLPDDLRERIEGRTAVHDFSQSFGLALAPDDLARFAETYPPVEHPIVRTHPETGRKLLYVNAIFTSHVVGLPADESERLLEALCRQAMIPEIQCRVRWESGTVVFWDNRATQHYASSDYWPHRRVMERVTVAGERPA